MRIWFVMPSLYKESVIMGNMIVSHLPSWKRVHTSLGDASGRWWIRRENRLLPLGKMIKHPRSGSLRLPGMIRDPKKRGPT